MSHLTVLPGGASRGPARSGATSVRVEAPGKVNLFLSAGAPGPDGYHQLTTVFQAVRLIETVTARRQSYAAAGTVTLTLAEADLLSGEGAVGPLPTDSRNLAVRAAELLAEHTGVTDGVDLLLRKRVPVAGGMAGGSADAAATLVACNHLWGTGLSLAELMDLASQLGADCAFPLLGSTAVGQGRGDELSPLMTRGTYHWLFAIAREGLSTPAVFAELDRIRGHKAPLAQAVPSVPAAPDLRPAVGGGAPAASQSAGVEFVHPTGPEASGDPTEPAAVPAQMGAALRAGDAAALAATLHNDLQVAAISLRPELAEIITIAEQAGALRAIVAGSGPTVAALVPDAASGMRVARALAASGLVARTVRADAPVAGARVVG